MNVSASSELSNISAAFDEYEKYTCIKFVRSNGTEPKILNIIRGVGCWSHVGYSFPLQNLRLASGCAGVSDKFNLQKMRTIFIADLTKVVSMKILNS